MQEEEQLPTTIVELADWLDNAYSDKIVTRELSSYEQGLLHGQIEVVRKVKELITKED